MPNINWNVIHKVDLIIYPSGLLDAYGMFNNVVKLASNCTRIPAPYVETGDVFTNFIYPNRRNCEFCLTEERHAAFDPCPIKIGNVREKFFLWRGDFSIIFEV
jgi:hypothetical protein